MPLKIDEMTRNIEQTRVDLISWAMGMNDSTKIITTIVLALMACIFYLIGWIGVARMFMVLVILQLIARIYGYGVLLWKKIWK